MDAQPGASADLGAVASAASPPEAPTIPLLAYRTWAWRFFAILDAVVILGGLLALTAQGQDPIAVAMLLILAGAGIAVLTVLLVGIDRSAAWAIHAIAPACSIIIVFGVLRAVVALTTNSIDIPLEVIGAGLVLSRPHPAAAMPRLSGRDPRSVTLMVGAMAAMQLAPYLAGPVGTGGLLGVQPADLDMLVEVRCDQVVAGRSIDVAVRWTWARSELLTPAADGILVQWSATTAGSGEPDPGLALDGQPRIGSANVWVGGEGAASGALGPHANESPGVEFGIHHPNGLEPARIDLELTPVDATAGSGSGSVEVWTWYAHGDRWTQQSQLVGCRWGTPA